MPVIELKRQAEEEELLTLADVPEGELWIEPDGDLAFRSRDRCGWICSESGLMHLYVAPPESITVVSKFCDRLVFKFNS